MHKKTGEDTDETRDINWSEGYPMPYDAVLSDESWEKEEEDWWCLSSQDTANA